MRVLYGGVKGWELMMKGKQRFPFIQVSHLLFLLLLFLLLLQLVIAEIVPKN